MLRAVAIIGVLGLCLSVPVIADPGVQFSAKAVQSAAGGQPRESLIYVGENQVRMERWQDNASMVEIYDLNAKRLLLLMPQQKMYMQTELPEDAINNPMLPQTTHDFCDTLPDASCKKLGNESLYDRSVSKWEVTVNNGNRVLRSLHWIDDQRSMSLRDVWPDASVTQMKLIGMVYLDGRNTEHWQRITAFISGKKDISMQWYDPELKIITREELPGGFFRALEDIEVAPQPASLFMAPTDYRQIDTNAAGQ
ncbi:hypothetical protein MNBD_GAMMA13-252 [hydrothermal vent metagenome]|uniref:DUF4412 domain-containing protein n=1 Tax=hydrothermal vent metagenome TaxID=652676 RepID=A0A3B0YEN0_9ZZZZ